MIVYIDIYHVFIYIPDDLYIRRILWLAPSAMYTSPVVGSISTSVG
jgi:hypothetical protein